MNRSDQLFHDAVREAAAVDAAFHGLETPEQLLDRLAYEKPKTIKPRKKKRKAGPAPLFLAVLGFVASIGSGLVILLTPETPVQSYPAPVTAPALGQETYGVWLKSNNDTPMKNLTIDNNIMVGGGDPVLSDATMHPPIGVVGQPFHWTLGKNTPPFLWEHTSGSLPPGLQITGEVIEGTPSAVGIYRFTVRGSGPDASAEAPFTIVVRR